MANQEERIFASGFSFKRSEKAPDFVIGTIGIKVSDAIEFLKTHEKNGWVNIQAKKSKTGNYYIELDTFEPKKGDYNKKNNDSKKDEEEDDDLPF